LAYSDEETEAIEYICDKLGSEFDVETDEVGNVFGTKDPDAERSLFLGSHLDSVFNGGRLDGALGVVAALIAIETAYEVGDPPIPPTLTVLRAEESSRFGQWGLGSRAALGQLTSEDFSATDSSSVPLWQAMQEQGFRPSDLSEPTIDLKRVAGFLELHIEQGRVLDESNHRLGIVTSIRAPVRYRVTVTGDSDHAGATPMDMRRDALTGGAEMVLAVEEIATEAAADGDVVATVGDISPVGGAINKVCGEATFPVDIRSNDSSHRTAVESAILKRIERISDNRELTVATTRIDSTDPVDLDESVTDQLTGVASSQDIDYQQLPSGGGHDAMNFQHAGVPTGMLFVPSVDGISHNPKERTPDGAIQDATAVLAGAILEGPPSRSD
jgi:hydantoinase/carbamoylase family amidase